ncbi:Fic family protein, partial [bacterium]
MRRKTGKFVKQKEGYKAFIPYKLPPRPSIKFDEEMNELLSNADRSIARLDGITTVLPNPDLFVAMYVQKEAVLSSQIEGTQASLDGVLRFEANLPVSEDINEIKEVVNYVKALHYGISHLKKEPLSLKLIKEAHKILVKGTRGKEKSPGEFRKTQNWIGPPGASIMEAYFIPPPPDKVPELMKNLESFILREDPTPPLVKAAIIHAQFETIHPFLDGNGRMGRLLISYYFHWRRILTRPILYLSYYLKKYREVYYDWLMKVRFKGDWEGWIKFFLKGVQVMSGDATKTAREIIKLREKVQEKLFTAKVSSPYAIKVLE